MKLKLNVYPVIPDMDEKLAEIIQKAVDNRAKIVEIAYGEAGESVNKRILNLSSINTIGIQIAVSW